MPMARGTTLRPIRHHAASILELGIANQRQSQNARTVLRYIEDNLQGEFMNGIHVLCSPGSSKRSPARRCHRGVRELAERSGHAHQRYPARLHLLRHHLEEHRGRRYAGGTVRRFVAGGRRPRLPAGHDRHLRHLLRALADFNETGHTAACRCTPNRSRASSTGAPTCTRSPTRCRCATAPAAGEAGDGVMASSNRFMPPRVTRA